MTTTKNQKENKMADNFNRLVNRGLGRTRAEAERNLELAKNLGLTPRTTKLEYDHDCDVYRFMVKA